MKKIIIEFERGGKFTAALLENFAPKTCEIIWNSLPIHGKVKHAMFSGQVIFSFVEIDYHEQENPMVMGLHPGDIMFNPAVIPSKDPSGRKFNTEILFVYGKHVLTTGTTGWMPVNLFAKITDGNLEQLEAIGKRVREQGMETVTLSKN